MFCALKGKYQEESLDMSVKVMEMKT